jgi:uncharacterized protein (DUF924 family)
MDSSQHPPAPAWAVDMLRFWFEETSREAWFEEDEAFDRVLAERFGALRDEIAATLAPEAVASPAEAVAAVIVLDQLPRNLFRGSPEAFATDAKALALARHAIARGFDRDETPERRLFLYLPFEHSESAAEQARSVALFEALGNTEWLRYAIAHKQIIDRFGRFPHRNQALGRISTAEEVAFLEGPMSSF